MTLTLDLPEDIAARLAELPEAERTRRATAAFRAFDAQETERPLKPGERSLADAIIEALGPEFAPDFMREKTSDSAREKGLNFLDINGKINR